VKREGKKELNEKDEKRERAVFGAAHPRRKTAVIPTHCGQAGIKETA
jgi:hypothetical protein